LNKVLAVKNRTGHALTATVQLRANVRDGFEKNEAPLKLMLAGWPNPRGPSADDQ